MVIATAERAPAADLPGGAVSVAMPGVVAVLVAFVGLSLGSTMAKSSGSPGAVVAFWRFVIGAVVWHAVIVVRGIRTGDRCTVDATAWRVAVVPGVAFGINLSCFFSGVTLTPVAHAEFINALAPLVLIPVAAVVLKERVRRHVVVCGAVALSGVLLILSPSPAAGTSYGGDLLVVASMLAWVAYLMTAKTARARVSTPQFMAVMSTVAALTTLPVALVVAGGPGGIVALSAAGWLLVSLLALVAGVASHGLITWAQRRVAVGTTSMLQLAQPALGVLWAATFLAEPVQPVQLIGMAIVLGAVGTIAWRTTHAPAPAAARP